MDGSNRFVHYVWNFLSSLSSSSSNGKAAETSKFMRELAKEIGKELRVGLKGGMEVLDDEAFIRVVVKQSLCCVFGKSENEHIVEVLVNWFKANDCEVGEIERFQCSVVEIPGGRVDESRVLEEGEVVIRRGVVVGREGAEDGGEAGGKLCVMCNSPFDSTANDITLETPTSEKMFDEIVFHDIKIANKIVENLMRHQVDLVCCSFNVNGAFKNALLRAGISYAHMVEEYELEMICRVGGVEFAGEGGGAGGLEGCVGDYERFRVERRVGGERLCWITGLGAKGRGEGGGGSRRATVAGTGRFRQLVLRCYSAGKLKQIVAAVSRCVKLVEFALEGRGKGEVVRGMGWAELVGAGVVERLACKLREGGDGGTVGKVGVSLSVKIDCLDAVKEGLLSVGRAIHGVRGVLGGRGEGLGRGEGELQPLQFTVTLIAQFVELMGVLLRVDGIIEIGGGGKVDRGVGKMVTRKGVRRRGMIGDVWDGEENEDGE
ncbi:hypothetical protein TrCOL_g3668 [Triparma columacea]|uniref:Uncharacterized protein n=1 Tax=Triparma columacea TaxID=722753 RepID=A0A9W7GKJ0_9STRA|nr:hypothetical protein TrCOL_g3668 [Triparma columacea]